MTVFAFPADRWQRVESSELWNITGHQRLNLKQLERLPPDVTFKVRAWTIRGVRKTTQGTLADLLAALHRGPPTSSCGSSPAAKAYA